MVEEAFEYIGADMGFSEFIRRVEEICLRVYMDSGRALAALGTLGGGNHFIEVDIDEEKNRWLLIHSGSRGFGYGIAVHHHGLAVERTHADSPIKFLSGLAAKEYIEDMKIAQLYAALNRALMAVQIGWDYFKAGKSKLERIESVHNYIDFENGIIRKGAVSAQAGEKLVIPFSMADGAVICTGKGDAEWNFSALHGSGRKMSRSRAKELSLDEYRRRMKNIWSSCVGKSTLDESPMAYKRVQDVLEFIGETVEINSRLKPVYNFKSA